MSAIRRKIVIVTLLIAAGTVTLFAQKNTAKSDKEKDGLTGPVASVRIEFAPLKSVDGKFVESARRLLEEYAYDRSGKLIGSQKKPVLGDKKLCDEKFKYDEKGREKEKYCLGDSKEKVLERYTYEEEDRYGNWTKRIASVPDINGDTFHVKGVSYREIEYFE